MGCHFALVVFEEQQEEILEHVSASVSFGRPPRQRAQYRWHDATDLHRLLVNNGPEEGI